MNDIELVYGVRAGGFDYYTLTYDEDDPYEEDSLPGLGSGGILVLYIS